MKWWTKMGKFGLIGFENWKMMDLEFRIGPGIYLCCHNYKCYGSMVGKGGEGSCGWLHRGSPYRSPTMCHLYWNREWMWWWWLNDAVPLRDLLHNWWDDVNCLFYDLWWAVQVNRWSTLLGGFILVISALLGPLGSVSRRGILFLLALFLLHWCFLASQVFMTS